MGLRSGLWSDGRQIKVRPDLECLRHDIGVLHARPVICKLAVRSRAYCPDINDSQGCLDMFLSLISFKIRSLNI